MPVESSEFALDDTVKAILHENSSEDYFTVIAHPTNYIYMVIREVFKLKPYEKLKQVTVNTQELLEHMKFYNIDRNSEIIITFTILNTANSKFLRRCISDIIYMNPYISPKKRHYYDKDSKKYCWMQVEDILFERATFNEKDNTIIDLNFGNIGLVNIPETLSELHLTGNLLLNNNKISVLPDNIGNLYVGGTLDLTHNCIASLPYTFNHMVIGGDLRLISNRLEIDSFSDVNRFKVDRDLYINDNNIEKRLVPYNLFKNVRGSIYPYDIVTHRSVLSVIKDLFNKF